MKRIRSILTTLLLTLVLCVATMPRAVEARQSQPSAAVRQPNVIFILSDDMGYADIGSYGSKDISTPNLDRLAREGVRLSNCYSNGPVCTPTRTGFV
ncbi:MAG: sulfatase-like hydrolase/transferase, partial [Acidobacteriota bacterium]|nr:sulfatase-like hydrolase/transferase [Acidobacteriota bacterium]